jgi:hypothetical protein
MAFTLKKKELPDIPQEQIDTITRLRLLEELGRHRMAADGMVAQRAHPGSGLLHVRGVGLGTYWP